MLAHVGLLRIARFPGARAYGRLGNQLASAICVIAQARCSSWHCEDNEIARFPPPGKLWHASWAAQLRIFSRYWDFDLTMMAFSLREVRTAHHMQSEPQFADGES